MTEKKIIKRVYNTGRQKLVTIPKNSDIEEGDYVIIRKIEDKVDSAIKLIESIKSEDNF